MKTRSLWIIVSVLLAAGTAPGEEARVPPGEKEPFLRVETGGHMSYITSVAFSPDGKRLYSAGFDKVIRVWEFDGGKFKLTPQAFRVPIGPGPEGLINTIAVSPDGEWLAAGGEAAARNVAGFRISGIILPVAGAMSRSMWQDRGQIYLFNTRTGDVRLLRGIEGTVVTLAFAPPLAGKDPILASASRERDLDKNEYFGRVRLWDVETGRLVESMRLEEPPLRPGLAVRHLGPGLRQLRVAIAWGETKDAKLRIWELLPDKGGLLYEGAPELPLNTAIAYLPGSRPGEAYILTGGRNIRAGQLRWWLDQDGQHPRPMNRAQYEFTSFNPAEYLFPQNIAFIRRRAGDDPTQAAVVVAHAEIDRPGHLAIRYFTLHVINLDEPGVQVETKLWDGEDMPSLAVRPGGDLLAVAGDTRTHNISMYRLPLTAGARALKLHGVGANFRQVAFATNDKKELGLILGSEDKDEVGRPARPPVENDFVFHIGQRRLAPDPRQHWKVVAPDLDGWTVEFTQRDEKRVDGKPVAIPAALVVRHGGEEKRLVLPNPEIVYDYALLPPMNGINTAILAVASWDLSAQEPLLYLYRVDTGEPVRQFKGHMERIRSIAFTPNGRLLASAADDQTVGVWSLSNLDRVLDRRGLIHGLGVRNNREDKTVVVAPFRGPSPARGKVAAKDVIEAVTLPDGKEVPVKTAMDFYLTIFQIKPRQTVGLRVKGKGVVNLVVGQGIDERKPLFSLFVTDGEDGKPRQWIGWSPVGPYDASGAQAEDYIGWHFNTGEADKPTTFAPAGQYRKQYYKEGILKYLVARGNVADAVKAWEKDRPPPPRPVLTPTIDESGPEPKKDAQGRILVQGRPVTLRLGIDNVDPDDIESVKWRFDGGAFREFPDPERGDWVADLSKQAWQRGNHRVEVVLRLKRGEVKEHTAALALRYQPPAPVVRLDPALAVFVRPGDGQVLRLPVGDSPTLHLKATVTPSEGQDASVTLVQSGKETKLGREIDVKRDLQPGENWIELRAVNVGALAGFEGYETNVWRIAATYQPPRMTVPPEIVLSEVRFGTADDDTVPVVPGQPVIVKRRVVHLLGRIKASKRELTDRKGEELTDVKCDGKAVAGFQGKDELLLDEQVTLEPGPQKIELSAKSKNSQPAQASVTIEFRPELPRVVVRKAGPREVIEGEPRPNLEIEAELVPVFDAPQNAKYEAVLLMGGNKLPVNLKGRKLSATIVLAQTPFQPGDNIIQLRLGNQWGTERTDDVLRLLYRRLPRIMSIDQPPGAAQVVVLNRPLLNLLAKVESPADLPLTRAEVNDRPAQARLLTKNNKQGVWEVTADDVPLREGDNDVTLRVWNADGEALRPRVVKVQVKPARRVPPPVVRFTDPLGTTMIVSVPTYEVRFSVASGDPLRSIELRRGDEVLFHGDPTKLQKNAMGLYEVSVPVQLRAGANPLEAVALNQGGEGRAVPVTLSYTPQPVHFEFDKVVLADQPETELKRKEKDRRIVFGEAPSDKVKVSGSVVWPDETDPRLDRNSEVRIWVNGFQQVPVELKRRTDKKSKRLHFEAEVVLNQKENNRIEFELPGLAQESGVRRDFLVNCAKPKATETWHILVVGVGDKDDRQLKERVLKAVRAQPGVRGAFRIRLYGPLTDDVSPEKVYAQLRKIKKEIDTRASRGSANDVLMVYYIGQESVKPEGHYFTTDVTQSDPDLKRSGLNVENLRDRFLQETLGARVVLLDVAREQAARNAVAAVDRVAEWTDKGKVGILRYSWQGGETIPTEARLLTAWNRFLDLNKQPEKTVVLDDVSQGVSQGFKQTSTDLYPRSTRLPELTMSENVPTGLRSLPLEQTLATTP